MGAAKPKTTSTKKFILLSLVTFGLYQMYWAWRAWEMVRQAKGETYRWKSSVRGYFLAFSSFLLFPQLQELAKAAGYKKKVKTDSLAGLYLVATIVGYAYGAPIWIGIPAGIALLLLPLPMLKMYNYAIQHSKARPPEGANGWLIGFLVFEALASVAFGLVLYPGMQSL
jgi:hypothetical protein